MRIVGLTGGIACGKSTVSRELTALGFPVVDADALARATTEKNRWGYRRLVRAFGKGAVLDPATGEIDRERLARLAFSDRAVRRTLDRATHPPVALALALAVLRSWLLLRPVLVVDMPLLFETGADRLASATLVVSAPEDLQVRRLAQRDGMDEEQARRRVGAQMPTAEKEARATAVLPNGPGVSREALAARVRALAGETGGPLRPAWLWAVATWPPALAAGAWLGWRAAAAAAAAASCFFARITFR